MSPYSWGQSNYACPECGSRLEGRAGPDGLTAERCPECGWSALFDPAADEFVVRELDRYEGGDDGRGLATDGGTPDPAAFRIPTLDEVERGCAKLEGGIQR